MTDEKPASPTWALVRREGLALARSGHMVMVLIGLMALLMLTAVAILPFVLLQGGTPGQFATTLFRLQFRYLYFAALIVVPVVASSAMVSEYKNDCFPMLYTTLIRPGWILWGKVISVVGLFGMLYIGCLPVSGLAYFYTGLETATLFQATVVLLSLALGTSSIGLLVSTRTKNHYQALYRTGGGILVLTIVLPLILGATRLLALPKWSDVMLGYLVEDTAYDTVLSGIPDWRPVFAFAVYQAVIAAFCLLAAWRRVLPDQSGPGSRALGWLAWIPQLGRPGKWPRPIADRQNPIAIRDARLNPMSNGVVQAGLCMVGLFLGYCMGLFLVEEGESFFNALGSMAFGIERYPFFLVVPPMVAMAFASERENNTLGEIRTSLLTAGDMLAGKTGGIWRILILPNCSFMAGKIVGIGVGNALDPSLDVGIPIGIAAAEGAALLLTVYGIIIFSTLGVLPRSSIAGAIIYSYISLFIFWSAAAILTFFGYVILLAFSSVTGSIKSLPYLHTSVFYIVLFGLVEVTRQSAIQGMQSLLDRG